VLNIVSKYIPIIPLWERRELIWSLTKRELQQRYRGSYLGFLWSFITPLVMLVIYTFVFSGIFKARWSGLGEETSSTQFALILFGGMAPFNIFSEVANRSSGLVVSVPNYVKKVIFPLEILPVVCVLVAFINSLFSMLLVVLGNVLLGKTISSTLYLLPLAYLPMLLFCLGLSWFLASIGVYLRDVGQGIGIVVQVLLFLSPVFYSISAVPGAVKSLMLINPLSTIITGFRQVLLWSEPLPWTSWAIWTVIHLVLAIVGFIWFMWIKKGFADVI
jgi:lipopolysaccharide transport system permease protein